MSRSGSGKWRAIAVLSVTLLVGIVLGAALVGSVVRNRVAAVAEFSTPEGFVEYVLSVIGPLSASQSESVLPILEARGSEVSARIQENREALRGIGDDMMAELIPHLTDEQRARLDASRERAQRKLALISPK